LAKPNYQFEKRQRDLAKRRKREEKRLRKLAQRQAKAGRPDAETTAGAVDDSAPEKA
jgi:hypothetical protein